MHMYEYQIFSIFHIIKLRQDPSFPDSYFLPDSNCIYYESLFSAKHWPPWLTPDTQLKRLRNLLEG